MRSPRSLLVLVVVSAVIAGLTVGVWAGLQWAEDLRQDQALATSAA